MNLPEKVIKAAQHAIDVETDGIFGPQTLAALREYDDECDAFASPDNARKLIVLVAQHAAGLTGKDLDGIYGPITERAVNEYLAGRESEGGAGGGARAGTQARSSSGMAAWARHEGPGIYEKNGVDLRDGTVLSFDGGLREIPTRKTLVSVYGDAKALGEQGMQKKLVALEGLPGRFNRGDGKLYGLHPLMAPHLRLALQLCRDFGVIDEIHRIGTFNYRYMRHDPSLPLSFHSYGICIDLNPRENFGWVTSELERSVQPFSDAWYRKYPRGLSEVAVRCFKKAGFGWGGDWSSFRDPMHFELVQ